MANSPSPTPPPILSPQNNDPFAFMMDNKPAGKKPVWGGFNKSSLRQRIMIVVGGVVILIILVSVGLSWLNRSRSAGLNDLVATAKKQSEIIRIAALGEKSSHDSRLVNLAITTRLSLVSQQTQLLVLIKARGSKLNSSSLAAIKNKSLEDSLASAAKNNSFDQNFETTLKDELGQYQTLLSTAFKLNSGPKTRAALQLAFKSSSDLIAKPAATTYEPTTN